MIYSKNETEAAITYLKFIGENFKYFSASEKQTHLNALEYHHSIFFSNLIVIDENYNSEIAYNNLIVSFLVQLNFKLFHFKLFLLVSLLVLFSGNFA
jgi:hypothetical protein